MHNPGQKGAMEDKERREDDSVWSTWGEWEKKNKAAGIVGTESEGLSG